MRWILQWVHKPFSCVSIGVCYKETGFRLKTTRQAAMMSRVRAKQTLKLRLLAIVLALALIWYSLNPAPRVSTRTKREDELPDEKKREAEQRLQRAAIWPVNFGTMGAGLGAIPSPNQDEEDDFDWPEFIDG
jgi:hypothetical protein